MAARYDRWRYRIWKTCSSSSLLLFFLFVTLKRRWDETRIQFYSSLASSSAGWQLFSFLFFSFLFFSISNVIRIASVNLYKPRERWWWWDLQEQHTDTLRDSSSSSCIPFALFKWNWEETIRTRHDTTFGIENPFKATARRPPRWQQQQQSKCLFLKKERKTYYYLCLTPLMKKGKQLERKNERNKKTGLRLPTRIYKVENRDWLGSLGPAAQPVNNKNKNKLKSFPSLFFHFLSVVLIHYRHLNEWMN